MFTSEYPAPSGHSKYICCYNKDCLINLSITKRARQKVQPVTQRVIVLVLAVTF